MEAMTAVSVALLTVYDMAKSADKGMRIEGIRLLEKDGGKSGRWRAYTARRAWGVGRGASGGGRLGGAGGGGAAGGGASGGAGRAGRVGRGARGRLARPRAYTLRAAANNAASLATREGARRLTPLVPPRIAHPASRPTSAGTRPSEGPEARRR